MKLHRLGKSLINKTFTNKLTKAALATAALGGFLFFAGAPDAKAANGDNDHRRFQQSERRYTDTDRSYYNQRAYQPQYEYRQFSERYDRDDRYYDRDSRNNWNRDRDDRPRYDRDGDRDRH
jgi:hypothetical protein